MTQDRNVCIALHVMYPLSMSGFIQILLFSRQFLGQYSNITFIKIRPVETESFHAYGWTDMKKLIIAILNFSNAPKTLRKECGIERLKVNERKLRSKGI